MAEEGLSEYFHVSCGVAAGCPQAPLFARESFPRSGFTATCCQVLRRKVGWVDDMEDHSPDKVAAPATQAWRDLKSRLDNGPADECP